MSFLGFLHKCLSQTVGVVGKPRYDGGNVGHMGQSILLLHGGGDGATGQCDWDGGDGQGDGDETSGHV